ncbi:MAG: tRNA (adenosine(37)-N6)-threonylcarbamoyltransferase complex dimerization subunit type 1 TsaB [Aliishimia sp.]
MSKPNYVLAFDTSVPHCAAALLCDGEVLGTACEAMSRGQSERLMPLIEELLARHDVTWQDLSRIGVGIGPGNFTGIRISVSAARGLALGLDIPAIGISSFDALRTGTSGLAAVAAPRDMAYLQVDTAPPELVARADIPETTLWIEDGAEMVAAMARLAAQRTPDIAPAPLYLRPADAAPPRDAPPVILHDS